MTVNKPVIVQSDGSILVEVDNPNYEAARDSLMRFCDLVKSPEHIHSYRLSPLSLWNAAACGLSAQQVLHDLSVFSRYPIPDNIQKFIEDNIGKFGILNLQRKDEMLELSCYDPFIWEEIIRSDKLAAFVKSVDSTGRKLIIDPINRGLIKQSLIKMGYPCQDLAGYADGTPLSIRLNSFTADGIKFKLREYQIAARDAFWMGGTAHGGSGIIVLPCGAGKTIVGMGIMEKASCHTLILTTNVVSLRQWINELLDKTNLTEDQVKEYSGEKKEIGPVTITTYQILTYKKRTSPKKYPHFSLFDARNWGLIIYDEVHLLPAPVFRITAGLQGKRRLGLTATLVREDGREDEVFSLIGPKKFDKPWKELEAQNWIAQANCNEIRLDMDQEDRLYYAMSLEREKYRIAASNPKKIPLVQKIVSLHQEDQILIIGQYLDQLEIIAQTLSAPLICGHTPNSVRENLYSKFKTGQIKTLVVSKVANFAVDLPDANVAIQVSGTFGSRQEEAQRLGRLLRPKTHGGPASFYSLVTRNTKDQDFSQKRQLFLTEQGYRYIIWEENTFCLLHKLGREDG